MLQVLEALAAIAGAGPAVLDARQPALVEGDSAAHRVAGADHAVVVDDQHDEGGERCEIHQAETVPRADEHGQDDRGGEDGQTGVTHAGVAACQRREGGAPRAEPLLVLDLRIGHSH